MASTSTTPSPPATPHRNWLELPADLTSSILQRLGTVGVLVSARKVCKTWRTICSDPSMWRVVNLGYSDNSAYLKDFDCSLDSGMEKLAKKAVDLSCGELVEFRIEDFASDELLQYIANRSGQLRRLQLVSCYGVSTEGLSEMIKKLPFLEELRLYYIPVSQQAIEVAGHCCPQLKSFSFNRHGYRWPHVECDEDALAVAENMPGLRYLQLFGNKLTSNGLLAIIEKCPYLESLDLRQCFNIANLEHDLAKRLSQKIKVLRLPYDSTEDYGYDAEINDWDSFDEDYPSGLSDIDIVSEDYDFYEFSGGSDIDMDSDYMLYDYI
ncbi:hypothetical protein DCAR_0831580 [Daucus carota subsp. sativus]|uniref:Uncharacterized protein n=1 Tax=Daucus carota subsp. sativus TaxID=79200 RepID=A0A175YLV9_DAUCS|nr:PREDICTED: putative F-box/LRR-repeat protein 9 [Daucus carota subsp. sativus]WOH12081.1 hypothetical protein DCAR_0831580 [Daucus carota subsp. sativus]